MCMMLTSLFQDDCAVTMWLCVPAKCPMWLTCCHSCPHGHHRRHHHHALWADLSPVLWDTGSGSCGRGGEASRSLPLSLAPAVGPGEAPVELGRAQNHAAGLLRGAQRHPHFHLGPGPSRERKVLRLGEDPPAPRTNPAWTKQVAMKPSQAP